MNALLQVCLVVSLMAMIPANAQRSPYVPSAHNYPALLPRFAEVDDSPASSTSTTQRPRQQRPQPSEDRIATLGNRLGEEEVRTGSNRPPCVECYVYITKSGDMIRVRDQNLRG